MAYTFEIYILLKIQILGLDSIESGQSQAGQLVYYYIILNQ